MRKYGAFLVEDNVYETHEKTVAVDGAIVEPLTKVVTKGGQAVGVEIDGVARAGFPTPSRRLEFFSRTLKEWRLAEQAVPCHAKSAGQPAQLGRSQG